MAGGTRREEYRTSRKGLRMAGARLRLSCSRSMALLSGPPHPTPPHPLPSAIPLPLLSLAGLSSLEAIFLFLARLYQITINIAVATCSPPPPPSTPSHRLRRRQRLNVGRKINTRSEEKAFPRRMGGYSTRAGNDETNRAPFKLIRCKS